MQSCSLFTQRHAKMHKGHADVTVIQRHVDMEPYFCLHTCYITNCADRSRRQEAAAYNVGADGICVLSCFAIFTSAQS